MAASMLYLSGQDWWLEGERFTTACTGTLAYRTRGWDCEKVRAINTSLVKRLMNAKFFEEDRISGDRAQQSAGDVLCGGLTVMQIQTYEMRRAMGEANGRLRYVS